MKSIPVISVKGGTGKSTICAGLGLALRDAGFRVGFLDCDVTGANLPSALGIPEPFPWVGLDTEHQKMLPVRQDGYEVFSLAFRFGKAALMWKGGEETVTAFGQTFHLRGSGRFQLVKQMLSNVQFSDLDYLLLDCPPGTGDETLSLWDNLKDLWGLVLVCQPTNLSVQDIERALNMVEVRKLPLIGMAGSMMETICPSCDHHFSPFLDGGVDLVGFCQKRGIPFLASIPLVPDREKLKQEFGRLADRVMQNQRVKIWELSFKQKIQRGVLRGLVEGMFNKGESWHQTIKPG
jgi:Mrp family chromosome partitioning ATPase